MSEMAEKFKNCAYCNKTAEIQLYGKESWYPYCDECLPRARLGWKILLGWEPKERASIYREKPKEEEK